MLTKKKSVGQKILISIAYALVGFIVMVAISTLSIYAKYKVDVFKAFGQVKKINQKVNISRLVTNPHSEEDMAAAKLVTDANLPGLISYSQENGYSITPDQMTGNLLGDMRFSDRQIAAILNTIMISEDEDDAETQDDSKKDVQEYYSQIVQVSISNITEKTAEFNSVLKLNFDELKVQMNSFPFTLLKKIIPDDLYFSSTVVITKGENAFDYTTSAKSMKINNLSAKESEHFLRAFAALFKLGTPKEITNSFGKMIVDMLIGTEENTGIAYALKDRGATDFSFETDGVNNYFVIEK